MKMKKILILIVLIASLLSCNSEEKLEGKWEITSPPSWLRSLNLYDDGDIYQFQKDGNCMFGTAGGTFELLDNSTIKVNFPMQSATPGYVGILNFAIKDNILTLTNSNESEPVILKKLMSNGTDGKDKFTLLENSNKNNEEKVLTVNEKTEIDFNKYENHPLSNTTLNGHLDNKPIILYIEKVKNDSIFGYNILGENKRPIKGVFSSYETQVEEFGAMIPLFVYEIEAKEPGDDEWDGLFEFEYKVSDLGYSGSGTWKAYNGKLERKLTLKYE